MGLSLPLRTTLYVCPRGQCLDHPHCKARLFLQMQEHCPTGGLLLPPSIPSRGWNTLIMLLSGCHRGPAATFTKHSKVQPRGPGRACFSSASPPQWACSATSQPSLSKRQAPWMKEAHLSAAFHLCNPFHGMESPQPAIFVWSVV